MGITSIHLTCHCEERATKHLAQTRAAVEIASLARNDKMQIEDASLAELRRRCRTPHHSEALTRAYLARIEAYDRAGPDLNSVREINPDALADAASCDRAEPRPDRPLAGIPILVKDNIATGDRHAHDGRVAGAWRRRALPAMRRSSRGCAAAGAVILGKANLTEFANIIAIDMPSGYSSLGGQVRNPYAPGALDERGVPLVSPGGSSSGSAVAVAAGLCAAAIGTETSGSLLSPATQNGLVTVKPTVGLISRAGILPIAHSQDTAGPLTRTVRDAAILLNVLAAPDPRDPATLAQRRPADYTAFLDPDGLRGARIGVPSDPSDPGNDVYFGKLGLAASAVMGQAIAALEAGGATIVRANIPTEGLDRRPRHRDGDPEPQPGKPGTLTSRRGARSSSSTS